MVTGWLRKRDARTAGAVAAGAIALAWLFASLAAATALELAGNNLDAFGWLLAAGSGPAVPIAAFCGRAFIGRVLAGHGVVWHMSAAVVILNCFLIAVLGGIAAGISAAAPTIAIRPLDALALFVATSGGFSILLFVGGIIYFGVPGLLIAIPSSWLWAKWMRSWFDTYVRSPVGSAGSSM
jgi:hypothetical protein